MPWPSLHNGVISGLDFGSLKVALSRLVMRGVITQYSKGRYGLPKAVGVDDLVPSLDAAAYITGMYALFRHNMITQVPTEVACFTNRRHNRSRVRMSPMGRVVFVCVSGSVYSRPEENPFVGPEQAFCDYVFLCRKRGVSPENIVTFRNLGRLDPSALKGRLENYPHTVQRKVKALVELSEGKDGWGRGAIESR